MTTVTKVFESELDGGIKYEIHTSQGFSGRSEIALKVEGEVVSVISVETKRTGNIFCRPAKTKAVLIKKFQDENKDPLSLNLDDVLDDGPLSNGIDDSSGNYNN